MLCTPDPKFFEAWIPSLTMGSTAVKLRSSAGEPSGDLSICFSRCSRLVRRLCWAWSFRLAGTGCLSLALLCSPARAELGTNTLSNNEQCIPAASTYHQVNAAVLKAILMVESGLNAWEVRRNNNGTLDVGMAGINSIHFPEMAKFGIAPGQLLDACVATYVAAWHLKKGMNKYGNTWFGIAAYHSVTPYLNNRYQVLVYNQLVKNQAIAGQLMKVPPITP